MDLFLHDSPIRLNKRFCFEVLLKGISDKPQRHIYYIYTYIYINIHIYNIYIYNI